MDRIGRVVRSCRRTNAVVLGGVSLDSSEMLVSRSLLCQDASSRDAQHLARRVARVTRRQKHVGRSQLRGLTRTCNTFTDEQGERQRTRTRRGGSNEGTGKATTL
jgi:hypothetical protein